MLRSFAQKLCSEASLWRFKELGRSFGDVGLPGDRLSKAQGLEDRLLGIPRTRNLSVPLLMFVNPAALVRVADEEHIPPFEFALLHLDLEAATDPTMSPLWRQELKLCGNLAFPPIRGF